VKVKHLLTITVLSAMTTHAATAANNKPETETEQISYSLGSFFGSRMQEVYNDLDPAMVKKGIEDALLRNKPAMDAETMAKMIRKAQTEASENMAKQMAQKAKENAEKSARFLTTNASEQGVISTDSGLQYKIIEKGSGDKAGIDSLVTVDYTGSLLDGTVFDSSSAREEPTTFKVSQVISGWQEALQLMPQGSRWKLFIPPDLAYGTRGAPQGGIGPNELLVFDVKLKTVHSSATGEDAFSRH